MSHMRRGRLAPAAAVLLALVALVVAACDGDEDPEPTTTPTATAGVISTPTAAPETATPEPTETATSTPTAEPTPLAFEPEMQVYEVPAGSGPHDVAPAADGGVWYTAQRAAALGHLDPETGETRHIALGAGSAPHGVIIDDAGDAWVTDGGLNAMVRVDAETDEVEVFPLPSDRPNANLNTAAIDARGRIWFTGQNGIYGRLAPETGEMAVFDAPGGRGPYGIDATPDGEIYYASLAGSYLGHVDLETDEVTVIEPPTAGAGVRRVWSDSQGRLWIAEWNVGQVGMYDPATEEWQEWPLPGAGPQAYSVYVDERDAVWLTDFGGNAIWRFDPETEEFLEFPKPGQPGNVRQMLGREGEVWAPESATDRLVVIRY